MNKNDKELSNQELLNKEIKNLKKDISIGRILQLNGYILLSFAIGLGVLCLGKYSSYLSIIENVGYGIIAPATISILIKFSMDMVKDEIIADKIRIAKLNKTLNLKELKKDYLNVLATRFPYLLNDESAKVMGYSQKELDNQKILYKNIKKSSLLKREVTDEDIIEHYRQRKMIHEKFLVQIDEIKDVNKDIEYLDGSKNMYFVTDSNKKLWSYKINNNQAKVKMKEILEDSIREQGGFFGVKKIREVVKNKDGMVESSVDYSVKEMSKGL